MAVSGGSLKLGSFRYAQYQAVLATADDTRAPLLQRVTIAAGWLVYAAAYAGFALATAAWQSWALFAVYGLHHALTEGPERALVAELAGGRVRGRAFGLYHAVTGALLLPASLITGALWQLLSPAAALLTGSALALTAAVALLALVRE